MEQWLPGKVQGGQTVTVHNLLEMRSGLEHFKSSPVMGNLIDSEPDHHFTLDEYLTYTNKVLATPGIIYDYNNFNYLTLQSIIEMASGQDYPGYVTQRLLALLDLTHTIVPYDN